MSKMPRRDSTEVSLPAPDWHSAEERQVWKLVSHVPHTLQPEAQAGSKEVLNPWGLSPAEMQVIELFIEGNNPAKVARLRGVLISTIHTQVRSIRNKMVFGDNMSWAYIAVEYFKWRHNL